MLEEHWLRSELSKLTPPSAPDRDEWVAETSRRILLVHRENEEIDPNCDLSNFWTDVERDANVGDSWEEAAQHRLDNLATAFPGLATTQVSRSSPLDARRDELRRIAFVGDATGTNLTTEERETILSLLCEYVDVFAFCLEDVTVTPTIKHHIPLLPGHHRTNPGWVSTINSPDQRKFLYEQVDKMLAAGIIREVDRNDVTWWANSRVVPKKDLTAVSKSKAELKETLEEAVARALSDRGGWAEQKLHEFPHDKAKAPKFRLVHAYLQVNDATANTAFPIGDLDAMTERLAGKSFITCLDMHSGYFAIGMDEEDVLKTTFRVEGRGYFAYNVMPFGLKGAPATFCELIATAFGPAIGTTMEAWMDDLATATNTLDEQLERIRFILDTCREHKLSLNPAKCTFAQSSAVWCGSHLSAKGREPDKAKVQAVIDWPKPNTPWEVSSFLNFAGYYRKFIKGFAAISELLSALTCGVRVEQSARRKDGSTARGAYKRAMKTRPMDWKWGPEQEGAFSAIKRALSTFPILRSPDWNQPFIIETDASKQGMGATLSQRFTYAHSGTGEMVTRTHPIAFASRATSAAEKAYPAFLLELACLKWATDKYGKCLFGNQVEIVTDCIALAGILSNEKVNHNHVRWRESILALDIVKFTHQPGKQHNACDELSRVVEHLESSESISPESKLPIDWDEYIQSTGPRQVLLLAEATARADQGNDLATPLFPTQPDDGLADQVMFLEQATALTALDARYKDDPLFQPLVTFLTTCQFPTGASHSEKGRLRQLARRYALRAPDVLLFKQGEKTRECIPLHERQQLIEDTHTALNHAGRDLMVVHLSERFYWPGMAQSVAPVIVTCERCQQFGKRVIRAKLWPITVLAPMDLLAMDYFSLPVSPNKHKSVLVVTDLFSRYVWAFKFKGEGTAKRTIEGLVEIIKTFGTPRILMSDGGTHFKNANVEAFCADKGILRITTPPYAPHTNGAVEGANKRILQAISRATVGSVDATTFSPWCQSLEAVVYAMNNRIIPATGYRPADLMFTFVRSMPSEGAPPDEQAIEILAHALTSWADLTLRAACMVADAEGRVSTAYQTMLDAQARRKEAKDRQLQRWNKAIPKDERDRPFRRGDLVLVHASWLEASRIGGKLQAHWLGPYRVVAPATRTDDAENPSDEHVTFWLESLGDSSPVAGRFHANWLKLFHPPHDFPLPTTEPMTLDEFHAAQRPKRQPPRTQNEDLPGDVLDDDTDTEDS
ncbi:BZ3500_MvSof-1268-A1-R1_Chr3-1g05672 [Microbotryum saponariae]|uniref:BZ3500_MvSof-1268-A1-R1_Chr3-1g05672 protein n=1 Tax=Microbotryum saponariae TaxID=289078 RepID=A0A2X0N120_9BASI|nr:BZ3500_MvSof-1268-A1-R1_Chr3-1g05672 [Microbotryum saponariae]SDA04862.1 BZ3501_MvSof-1269-A2-R1_Chr3-1g05342 [Microbotryum saponariae]